MKQIALLILIIFTIACHPLKQTINQKDRAVENIEQTQSDENTDVGGPPTIDQLIGVWKMIDIPSKEMNKVDPWPLPYQWFYFDNNGKVYSMMKSEDSNYTEKELINIFSILQSDKTPNYVLSGQFIKIDNPGIKDYQELWGINIFAKDVSFIKQGNIVMTLDDGAGDIIYYRLLERVR